MKNKYLAFVLDELSRNALLKAFPPVHEKTIAHHVTIQFNVTEEGLRFMQQPLHQVKAVAYAQDERVDCVLINFNGTCKRLDGSFYHVTLSTSPIGKPVHSNELLRAHQVKWADKQMVLTGKLELVDK